MDLICNGMPSLSIKQLDKNSLLGIRTKMSDADLFYFKLQRMVLDNETQLLLNEFKRDPKLVFLTHPVQGSLFMAAVKYNAYESLDLLVNLGANINEKTDLGYTALMRAASWGNFQLVQLLLQLGADCTHRNQYNCSAFEIAMERKDANVNWFELFKSHQEKLDERDLKLLEQYRIWALYA
jgi:ankyrin repeat protein